MYTCTFSAQVSWFHCLKVTDIVGKKRLSRQHDHWSGTMQSWRLFTITMTTALSAHVCFIEEESRGAVASTSNPLQKQGCSGQSKQASEQTFALQESWSGDSGSARSFSTPTQIKRTCAVRFRSSIFPPGFVPLQNLGQCRKANCLLEHATFLPPSSFASFSSWKPICT